MPHTKLPQPSFRALIKYALAGSVLTLLLLVFWKHEKLNTASDRVVRPVWEGHNSTGRNADGQQAGNAFAPTEKHPIEELVERANRQAERLLSKQSLRLETAARRYRQRRGRHPPPGFDKWFEYAARSGAIIVEDFFDRIYHDLKPFWAIEPETLRLQAKNSDHVLYVRNREAGFRRNNDDQVPWMELWHGLVKTIQEWLPDVDMPMNMMDEPRLLVPWEKIESYVKQEQAKRWILPPEQVETAFHGLMDWDAQQSEIAPGLEPSWITAGSGAKYWDLYRQTCDPRTPAASIPAIEDLAEPPSIPAGYPEHSYAGYVQNATLTRDPCQHPHLRGLHGTFIEPISMRTTQELVPLFGGSKLPGNNEILLPAATYLNPNPLYSGGNAHGPPWDRKKTSVLWRGVASGGRNKADTWRRFQRHRFVQMLDPAAVRRAETMRSPSQSSTTPTGFGMPDCASGCGESFRLPSHAHYRLLAPRNGYLSDWLSTFSDVGFTHLLCFPDEGGRRCSYTDPFFELQRPAAMRDMYAAKYLPDVDGNSFSGRYRAFLLSTSLPLKATIYAEWHDDRLVPWAHYVPLDNTFADLYAVLEFFLGFDGFGAHDDVARRIADEGKAWAEKVLRREDMALYTWRVILEWARLCDDAREVLGFVDDLRAGPD